MGDKGSGFLPQSDVRTIITLSNAVLYPSPLSEIGYLSPVFVWIGTRTHGTAGTVGARVSWRCGCRKGACVARLSMHHGYRSNQVEARYG